MQQYYNVVNRSCACIKELNIECEICESVRENETEWDELSKRLKIVYLMYISGRINFDKYIRIERRIQSSGRLQIPY